jgi:hypothetical protein
MFEEVKHVCTTLEWSHRYVEDRNGKPDQIKDLIKQGYKDAKEVLKKADLP